jgi:hypothetical protein
MMGYRCSECGRPIGLIANKFGTPEKFKCPHTGRIANVQTPIRRDTAPLTLVGALDIAYQANMLQQGRIRHGLESNDSGKNRA